MIVQLNTKYITISQNTTKIIVLCCTICFTTTCFGPFLQAIFRLCTLGLEGNVSYIQIYYIEDEISVIIIQLSLIMVGMQVDYYGWVLALGVGWQGWNNVSILLLCKYSFEWLSLCCTILAVSATRPVCLGFLCRYAPLCEDKKEEYV